MNTTTNNRTCDLTGWCDGETKAVATIIMKGAYSNYEQATCRACFLGILEQEPTALHVEQED